jgi:hypothetical protein
LYVGASERESADAVASILQKIQVNSEDRDVALRLLKTGGLSVAVTIDFISIPTSLPSLEIEPFTSVRVPSYDATLDTLNKKKLSITVGKHRRTI